LSGKLTRRTLLQTAAAAAGVTALNAPFVSGANAAGRLSCGFWDHWVPTALDPMRKICQEWADKNKVDLNIDFITSNGDKLLLTIAAEAQARSGHDLLSLELRQSAVTNYGKAATVQRRGESRPLRFNTPMSAA